ncbi:Trypanosomal VSG domain containing protein, putative [Trypanosoma equiperdum]|uniref:Trypanosome variant surface glycoprotein B-type N-terminal domain-containing protein n=2 Tax=Trypanozoon TaxID=39700 RepID=Q380X1_TRYB2|nr:hypothetical protein, conserved [Trypanosoma brucei brucei TREU927]EAN80660.1 hypothetical protein, conserved [Trypanosoma brucei brucei TREU927]SCU66511.1 Trypanosomal VSG domain containing protein, putative [Trypanosoma equiperdum]
MRQQKDEKTFSGALVYLGTKPTADNCGLAANEGCVDITELAANKAAAAVKTENWIDKLSESAETLRIAEADTNKRKETVVRLQNLVKGDNWRITPMSRSPDPTSQRGN